MYSYVPSVPMAIFGIASVVALAIYHGRRFWWYTAGHFWAMYLGLTSELRPHFNLHTS
jgi:hypothetical protein